jgi:hypothetical protein
VPEIPPVPIAPPEPTLPPVAVDEEPPVAMALPPPVALWPPVEGDAPPVAVAPPEWPSPTNPPVPPRSAAVLLPHPAKRGHPTTARRARSTRKLGCEFLFTGILPETCWSSSARERAEKDATCANLDATRTSGLLGSQTRTLTVVLDPKPGKVRGYHALAQ